MLAGLPWAGPVGAVRVGRIEGDFILNPTFADLEYSDLDLRMAGTRDAILMVECGASAISEEIMVEALEFGHKAMQPLIDIQERMAAEVSIQKRGYIPAPVNEELAAAVRERASAQINQILEQPYIKSERNQALDALKNSLQADLAGDDEAQALQVIEVYDKLLKSVVRQRILEHNQRPDGRGLTDIRDIWCEVDVSPRAHGSGLFTRG